MREENVQKSQKGLQEMIWWSPATEIPVSYTHLDVYKRQSIDSLEPIFGLAVTGKVAIPNLKKNDTATEGCLLYLTKKLGVGILTTAQKKRILKDEHADIAPQQMMQLNQIGAVLGTLPYVTALTDVTGFGLLGHLIEMAEGSGLSA